MIIRPDFNKGPKPSYAGHYWSAWGGPGAAQTKPAPELTPAQKLALLAQKSQAMWESDLPQPGSMGWNLTHGQGGGQPGFDDPTPNQGGGRPDFRALLAQMLQRRGMSLPMRPQREINPDMLALIRSRMQGRRFPGARGDFGPGPMPPVM